MYAYTRTPRIHSGTEHFRIENFVRPVAEARVAQAPDETLFVFPFDHDAVPAEIATREIAAALGALQPRILLFLRNIERLRTGRPGAESSAGQPLVIERSVAERPGASRRVTVSRNGRREEWLAWQRPVEGHPGQRVEIAFRLENARISALAESPLTVFFPTEKETFLGFLIQGPYRTTPARDNVPGEDASNQALVRQTAALLVSTLPELRDEGLLTADALQALPLNAARFPVGSMFRPLFDAAGDALTAEALVPAAGGGYAPAVDLLLAGSPEVLGLLDPGQLGTLCGAGRPVWFADAAISERHTPVLWRYLRDEIGLDEVTPEAVVTRVTGEFLGEQDDRWITRFYQFLAGHPSLWPAAGAKPVIRLEDGRQIAPLDGQGRPAVYLPGPAPSSLPTVKRAIADSAAARPFLAALQLTVPDVVAEVLQIVLPRYDGLDLAALDPAQHDADLERVARALDEAAAGQRQELLSRVTATPFLIGENTASGERALRPPPLLYQRTKDLETYFEGNPDAWFARDGYGPWLVQLRAMGVRQAVEVRARTPNAAGYVTIAVDFGRERARARRVRSWRRDRRPGLRAGPPQPRPFGVRLERPARAEPPPGGRGGRAVRADLVQRLQPGAGQVGDGRGRGARGLAARPGRGLPPARRAVARRPAADLHAGRRAGPGAGHAPARGQRGGPPARGAGRGAVAAERAARPGRDHRARTRPALAVRSPPQRWPNYRGVP